MSNLTADERDCVALPTEASEQSCGGCSCDFIAPRETISADEGDGSAMVDLVCPNPYCGSESVFYWTLTDDEYGAVFGHDFGEDFDLGEDPDR